METINFNVVLNEGATLPTRAHDTDVGYDVTAAEVEFVYEKPTLLQRLLHLEPRIVTVKCDTGVQAVPCDKGYWLMGVPNSRVAKLPFVLGNSCGVIDPDYTGTIRYIYNVLPTKDSNKLAKEYFKKGAVIGQLLVMPRTAINATVVDTLEKTERGDGGFGSTAS